MAAAAPAPSGRGAVRWWASEVAPKPRILASGRAPRSEAFSASSTTSTAPPKRADSADPRAQHAGDAVRFVGQPVALPARVGQGLVPGDQRELAEAVRTASLLHRQMVGGLELAGRAFPVLDPGGPGTPTL